MKRRFFLFAILLTLGLVAGPAFAGDPKPESADPSEAALLETRRQQIHELVMLRLNNALELSPTQSEQISQVLRKYRKQKTEYRNKIRQLTLQIRDASGSTSEAQYQTLIKQVTEAKAQLDKVDDQMFGEAKKFLNTRQQAQFLFVMEEIRREMQAVRRNAPPPGGGAVNAIQGGAGSGPVSAPVSH